MNEIIKINFDSDRQTTSARSLWEFLGKPWGEFMKWFSKFSEYGFTENIDYKVIEQSFENPQGGRPATDYEITIDMAKELSMLQKTEKGKQARTYFLELEKKWNSPEAVMARALSMANKTIDGLKLLNSQKDQIIGELKPRADYTDTILRNKGLVTITQIAKDYGMTGKTMNDMLHTLGIQFKQSEQWLLYERYQNKGYTHSETVNITRTGGIPDIKMNTKWTQKGRLFIYGKLKDIGVLPVIERRDVA